MPSGRGIHSRQCSALRASGDDTSSRESSRHTPTLIHVPRVNFHRDKESKTAYECLVTRVARKRTLTFSPSKRRAMVLMPVSSLPFSLFSATNAWSSSVNMGITFRGFSHRAWQAVKDDEIFWYRHGAFFTQHLEYC